jgi:hypothetical protein
MAARVAYAPSYCHASASQRLVACWAAEEREGALVREPVKQELTFQILDDFALGVQRGRVDASSVLPMLSVNDIGPLIELYLYARSDRPLVPSLGQLPQFKRVLALHQALEPSRRGRPIYLDDARTGRSVGFLATAHRSQAGLPWDDFCLKARIAAGQAGLEPTEARALIGALIEIEENVHLHSQRAEDGIVAFSASPARFEFAVGDSGVGVLNSLRSHPDYAALADAGTALRLALENGHSRYGPKSGHGLGFNALFVGLAALNAELRFRSDDHALTISGAGPSLVASTTLQRPSVQGFMASVVCAPLQASLLH